MNEVKIQIPDNCELIKNGDTYIVKKKKQEPPRSWEEFCERCPKQMGETYIDSVSNIGIYTGSVQRDKKTDKNICVSKEEAKAFLALMQLRQLRKAWVGDWEQDYENFCAVIFNNNNNVIIGEFLYPNGVLSFPTKEMAEDFLNCFGDLCEIAKILL